MHYVWLREGSFLEVDGWQPSTLPSIPRPDSECGEKVHRVA